MYIYAYVYICICVYTHIYVHKYMYICIYAHTLMNCCLSWAKTSILQKLWRNLLSFGNFSKNLFMSVMCHPSDSLAQ